MRVFSAIGVIICLISLLALAKKAESDRTISKVYGVSGDRKAVCYYRAKNLKNVKTMEAQVSRAIALWDLANLATEWPMDARQELCAAAYKIIKKVHEKAPGYRNVNEVVTLMEKAKK